VTRLVPFANIQCADQASRLSIRQATHLPRDALAAERFRIDASPTGVSWAASMSSRTIPKSHRDLLEAPVPVTLATVGPSGHPQLTAVWVVLDGDVIVTSLAGIRQKLKNLMARPLATVFVIDPANPYRTLEVRCDVTIEPDPNSPRWRGCSVPMGPIEPRSRPHSRVA
jgi:PPOX class probable F420-dependent enzyme